MTPPFHWTRRWPGKATERPRRNHKPNSFANLATAQKHARDFTDSYAIYGESGCVTVKIYDATGVVETWQAKPRLLCP